VYSGTDWVPLASEVTNLSGYQTKALNQFAYRNLLINGAMQIAQRGTSTASITGTGYAVDRFPADFSSLGTWTVSQESDGPAGSGFTKSAKLLCTTADASPAAGDYGLFRQSLEGQNLQSIRKGTASAQQLTLSFWVKSNVTGTYIIEFVDTDNTRSISKSYTISSSATWEYKTVTVPADTTGVLDNDNNGSFALYWWLGAGSTWTSGTLASTTWVSPTSANRAVGQTNVAAATNNYWQVTGVQLEVGDTATPFEFKPYAQDLQECQRYFYLHASGADEFIALGTYMTNTDVFAGIYFPVTMRVAPTAVSSAGSNYFRFWTNGLNDDFDSIGIQVAARSSAGISQATGTVSGTAYRSGFVRTNNALASIAFNSEL